MSFDRLAPFYPLMEFALAGEALQRCRLAFLEEAASAREILLVGEGHGRFLSALPRVNPGARISCVDASAEMLSVAQRRLDRAGGHGNVHFIPVPILDFMPGRAFDLIVTQFFLDCFAAEELKGVIEKLFGLLKPGGRWLVCDFQVPPRGWKAARARLVLFLAYRFFRMAARLPTRGLVPPQPFLLEKGLRRSKRQEFNFKLLYAELWENQAGPGNDSPRSAPEIIS